MTTVDLPTEVEVRQHRVTKLWQIHCDHKNCGNLGGNYKDQDQAETLAKLHSTTKHPAR